MSKLASWMLEKIRNRLLDTCQDYLERQLPPARLAPVAALLCWNGRWPGHEALGMAVAEAIAGARLEDGGWCNVEETCWSLMALSKLPSGHKCPLSAGRRWLHAQKRGDGWGFSIRHSPCIPATAIARLALNGNDAISARWLSATWCNDLESKFKLSYKASWYLLARDVDDEELAVRTATHLVQDQRGDGSWGPWKEHPAPADCFSTGIAMLSLAAQPDNVLPSSIDASISRAIGWMCENILESGFFRTHYLEYGTAWLYAGLENWLSRGW